MYDHALSF